MLHIPATNEPSKVLAMCVQRGIAALRCGFCVWRKRQSAPDGAKRGDHKRVAAGLI
jgi:hypothetical protein